MKNIYIFLTLCLSLISCVNSKFANTEVIIKDFPQQGYLQAEIKKIPPIAMTPSNLFVTGNHLILYNPKKDTLFDVFSIPDLKWLYCTGIQGQGPQDFYQLERRLFQPTNKGFKIFTQAEEKLKEVWVTDSTLWIDNDHAVEFPLEDPPANGVLPVSDSQIIYWGNPDSEAEYVLHDKQTGIKPFGSYPQWSKSVETEVPISKYVKNSTINKDHTRFVSFYGYFKRFRIYDTDGNLLKDVAIQHPPFDKTINERPEERTIYYHIPPQVYGNYIYVMCKNATRAEDKIQELQVWNWEGEPIARYDMDRKLTLFTISQKDKKIYAVDGENEDNLYVYDLPIY